jgi:hypothetical protein
MMSSLSQVYNKPQYDLADEIYKRLKKLHGDMIDLSSSKTVIRLTLKELDIMKIKSERSNNAI